MKTITTQLIAEKKLLSDPKRWTKGYFARDANGIHVGYLSKDAVCWCQMGAGLKIGFNVSSDNIKQLVARMFNHQDVVSFNDAPETTHDDLMKFYDACIKESKRV